MVDQMEQSISRTTRFYLGEAASRRSLTALSVPEAEVLSIVWQHESITPRSVHAILRERRRCAYVTVRKLLNRLADKGLLTQEKRERAHTYRACDGGDPAQLAKTAPLQAEVLAIVQAMGCARARDVREVLLRQRAIAHTTVQTEMVNLMRKGLLVRQVEDTGSRFSAAVPPAEVMGALFDALLGRLTQGRHGQTLAYLLGLPFPMSAEQINELRRYAGQTLTSALAAPGVNNSRRS